MALQAPLKKFAGPYNEVEYQFKKMLKNFKNVFRYFIILWGIDNPAGLY